MKPESYASRKMADAWDRGFEDALVAAAEFIGGRLYILTPPPNPYRETP